MGIKRINKRLFLNAMIPHRFLKYLLLTLFFLGKKDKTLWAQDIHFSSLEYIPVFITPTLFGAFYGSDYRIGSVYRIQKTPSGPSYNTIGLWGDMNIHPVNFDKGWGSMGFFAAKDEALSVLNTYKIQLAGAYHHYLSDNWLLSTALGVSFTHQEIDQSKLIFGDQFDGRTFSSQIATQEARLNTSVRRFSLYPALTLTYFTDKDKLSAGFGINEVNRPKSNYLIGIAQGDKSINPVRAPATYRSPLHYRIHVHYAHRFSENVSLRNYAFGTYWHYASEFILGSYVDWNLSPYHIFVLTMGLGYRINRSGILTLGLKTSKLQIGLTYDLSLIRSRFFLNNYSAFEIGLIYSGEFFRLDKVNKEKRKRVACFHF